MVTKKNKVVKKAPKKAAKKSGGSGAKQPSPRRILTEILVRNNKTKYTDQKICELMATKARNKIYQRPSYVKWLREQINAGKIQHAKLTGGKIHEVINPNAKPTKATKKAVKKPVKAKPKAKKTAKKTAKKAVKAKA